MGGGWRTIVVDNDVYLALAELKKVYNARSFSEVIRRLIRDAHGGIVDAGDDADTGA